MKKYKYSGPHSGADIGGKSYIFHNGGEYDLPEDNAYVKGLVILGYLKEMPHITEPDKTQKKEAKNAG